MTGDAALTGGRQPRCYAPALPVSLLVSVLLVGACSAGKVGSECSLLTEKDCGEGCISVLADNQHCGGCDVICKVGEVCCNKTCMPENDGNCGSCGNRCHSGQYCRASQCVPCEADWSCGPACIPCSGTEPRCFAGRCAECSQNDHCGEGRFCKGGSCAPCVEDGHCGLTCKPCPVDTFCDGKDCVTCSNHSDCPPGKFCSGTVCKPCNTHEFCGPNCEACSGTAKPYCNAEGTECASCGNDTHCPAGKYCEGGTCVTCLFPEHCGPLCAKCVGTDTPHCLPSGCAECTKGDHCQAGWRCSSGACLLCNTDDFCGITCATCGPSTPFCNDAGTTCVQCKINGHCAQGFYCNSGVCAPCQVDGHCGVSCVACGGGAPHCNSAGTACVECLDSTHCAGGYYCNGGSCAPCNTDAHCGPTCLQCPAEKFCNGVSCVGCCGGGCIICKPGEFCDGSACAPCNTDDHCSPSCVACSGATPHCKSGTTCVQCLFTSQCPTGNYCTGDQCKTCDLLDHCGPSCVACGGTKACCGAVIGCADLKTDKLNCGMCGRACSTFCNAGMCDASLKCSVGLSADIYSTPAIDAAGNVYVATTDGKVTSFNPDCSQRWTTSLGSYTSSSPVLSSDDATLYVATTAGPAQLFSLSAATGSQKWSYQVSHGWSAYNTPAVGDDGTVYVVGNWFDSGDYHEWLHAVTPTGVKKWGVSLGVQGSSTNTGGPAIGKDGTIYALTSKAVVFAVSPAGSKKWSKALTCCVTNFNLGIGSDGDLYAASSSGKIFYKLGAASGNVIWSKAMGAVLNHGAVATSDVGRVFLPLSDGTIHAYDGAGGTVWSYAAGGCFYAGPALGSDGMLYALNGCNGKLVALDSATGTPTWSIPLANAFVSSPNLSSDGILWVGAEKKLYAVTTGAVSGLSTGGWPKRHADRRNAGRD